MQIKVERCLGDKYRLTIPKIGREFIRSDRWTRKEAIEALDLLENVYKIPRKSVRFDVK